ncbi:helix-turn-helix domain-containing protein [Cylindrospermopsis raciborskii]|uniref:helix-turn-helix domain-containing protein n=1 Tax=Cylindrospermopsis raciborskii TaxID=77022 RepID=UPI002119C29D|nr:helix-turn-helix domain-containing protein [Cylindrospermopsis raciborskii]
MPKPYSVDLRNRVIVVWATQEGSQRQLAERFKVSLSFVTNLVRRYRETGQVEPKQCGGYEKPIIEGQYLNMIKAWIDEKNDLLLSELSDRLREKTGIKLMLVSQPCIEHYKSWVYIVKKMVWESTICWCSI